MSEELKPCPFCGGEAEYEGLYCYCLQCESRMADNPDEADAIACWNRRAPMTALTPAAEEGERRVHELKTWPPYFGAVKRGEKTFELRKNDRDYRVGDWLRLCEWLPALECYSGEECEAQVTYLLDGGQFGLEPGFCILGLSFPQCRTSAWTASPLPSVPSLPRRPNR